MEYNRDLIAAAQAENVDAQFRLALACETGKDPVERGVMDSIKSFFGSKQEDDVAIAADPAQAVQWHMAAATRGHAKAQLRLGQVCEEGLLGVEPAPATAASWYGMAANQGSVEAQLRLAKACENGELGIAKDLAAAVPWYRLAAEGGKLDAQMAVARCYDRGEGVESSPPEAARFYEMAANQGNVEAQARIGEMYADGYGVKKNDVVAARWLRKAAGKGSPDAMFKLGLLHYCTSDLERDEACAAWLWEQAADLGHARSCTWLGIAYEQGRGVPEDGQYALFCYEKGARLGDSGALSRLRDAYEEGVDDQPPDYKKAFEVHKALAEPPGEKPYSKEQLAVALACWKGRGVERDFDEAVKWFRKAADNGSDKARVYLAVAQLNGAGLPKDEAAGLNSLREEAGKDSEGRAMAQLFLGDAYRDGFGVPKDQAEAIQWYEKAAENKSSEAMVRLGFIHLAGDGVPKDEAKAFDYVESANDAMLDDRAAAKFVLGSFYSKGIGCFRDTGQAAEYWLDAAEGGNAAAQVEYAKACMDGEGVERDLEAAERWLAAAASQGHSEAPELLRKATLMRRKTEKAYKELETARKGDAEAQFFRGCMNHQLNEYEQAAKWIHRAARQNCAVAQDMLGDYYYSGGHGLQKSGCMARKWYQAAALNGNSHAARRLGLIYYKGDGVKADMAEAVKWLTVGADNGDADSQTALGMLYMDGEGVERDEKKAAEYLVLAAAQDHPEATYRLSLAYKDGHGVKEDVKKSFKVLRRAAELGVAQAQLEVGEACLKGHYCFSYSPDKDKAEAVKWLTLAAKQGNAQALALLNQPDDDD